MHIRRQLLQLRGPFKESASRQEDKEEKAQIFVRERERETQFAGWMRSRQPKWRNFRYCVTIQNGSTPCCCFLNPGLNKRKKKSAWGTFSLDVTFFRNFLFAGRPSNVAAFLLSPLSLSPRLRQRIVYLAAVGRSLRRPPPQLDSSERKC